MNKRVQQLSDTMQTTCPHCNSVFMISQQHLDAARGQVRCGVCRQVFNAILSLENFNGDISEVKPLPEIYNSSVSHNTDNTEPEKVESETAIDSVVSLDQAMFGEDYQPSRPIKSFLWLAGIVILFILIIVQTVYYQRYSLIAKPGYQQQILNLCRILPCDQDKFSNLSQIKLLERNIFTHPTQPDALMVNGSFVNRATFTQKMPDLLISLSDAKGRFIASRLFRAEEFLADNSITLLAPGKPVQFRLEIHDPGSEALAYEFEFFESDKGI